MSKLILLFLLLWNAEAIAQQPAFAAKKTTSRNAKFPAGIKFRGELDEAWSWKDSLGENILILTSHSFASKDSDSYSYELFAYHYCKKDTGFKILWRLNDIVKECIVDVTCEFIEGATHITDIDKDGIAETTVQYKLICRGDITPPDMKLIMHEDSGKYALRGAMWNPYMTGDTQGKFPITEKNVNLEALPGYKKAVEPGDSWWDERYGRYESEKDFKNAPLGFLSFARRQWLKYAQQKPE